MNETLMHRLVMGALVVYVVAAAIPFVPGAEIGLALLLVFGAQASPVVYAGMVGALLLSFGVASFVPLPMLAWLADRLLLKRVARFLAELADTPKPDRARLVSSKLDGRLGTAMLRNRYVVLAILLNLPGNSVLGGGGGLAFLAGISGLYSPWWYLLTVTIAVAPIPLAFLLIGS
ncbi:hypothetical protein OEW28_12575 [Defluviimonas sp. WL0002]|uniref:DedA family protein n=1 Tax=Albidovulum marisflavi TaxID=2984159 RepID=A0ABT2ZEB9_9RHOB|nr:hypothetical protein [Defluviimonas sp. WL0002]MCV2869462.1 hypothetical protein [Defluviimonas sp. WL0002]